MSPRKFLLQQKLLYLLITLGLICAVFIIIVPAGVGAEKTSTNLTIGMIPNDPSLNQSFHVSGILASSDGKPLGNKRVTLESSQKSAQDSDSFEFIGIKDTDAGGKYDYFRPVDSPPEFLRVKFAGNDNYAPAISPVIGARGAGTDHPQVRAEKNGSIMIYTTPQGADVLVDDILRGVSPYHAGGLPEGSHVVTVAKKGYQNETMDVYVTSENDASLDITLKQ